MTFYNVKKKKEFNFITFTTPELLLIHKPLNTCYFINFVQGIDLDQVTDQVWWKNGILYVYIFWKQFQGQLRPES